MENEKNKILKSTLYLVGTPIGNLADISERAKKTLAEVDFIAAEDTRNSLKLLNAYGIKKEIISYHEHNKKSSGEYILSRLSLGESCAIVTDAGMPAISDPGEDIVRLCAENGIRVSVIPGPSASVSALCLSGLDTTKFVFEGFLPVKGQDRRARLDALKGEERTMILYEAPHKLRATLKDLIDTFGSERKISLCRELTKLNEEIIRTTLNDAQALYEKSEPRGEYVLIVEGLSEARKRGAAKEEKPYLALSPTQHIEKYMEEGLSKMEATKRAARERGISKSEMYALVNK